MLKGNIFPVESSTLYDMYFTEYEFSLTPEENQVRMMMMTIVMTIMIVNMMMKIVMMMMMTIVMKTMMVMTMTMNAPTGCFLPEPE